MTGRNACQTQYVRLTRVAVALLFALLLGSAFTVGGVAGQPDCEEVSFAEYSDGFGVENVEQLQCITESPSRDYILRSNIDASETASWNEGNGFEPIGVTFRGNFDGNGYTIRGLTIDRADESEVGIFASVGSRSVVENVRLNNVDVTGDEEVGGLVGGNEGEVRDSRVSGSVSGKKSVGGVVGINRGGNVVRVSSTADVTGSDRYVGGVAGRNTGDVGLSHSDSKVQGGTNTGGLVGYNLGQVYDSYSTSDVDGHVTIGGLVGHNRGNAEIRTSYAAGTVSGTSEVRGLVGLNTANVEVSYFDTASMSGIDADPEYDAGTGIGLTTEEMTGERARQTLEVFDFDDTWTTVTDPEDYPVLTWQTEGTSGPNGEDVEQEDGEGNGDQDGEGEDPGTDGQIDDEADDDGTEGTDEETDEETDDGMEDEDMEENMDDGATEDDGAEDGTADDESADGESADGEGEGMPGFGSLAGFLALLGGALLLSRRRGPG